MSALQNLLATFRNNAKTEREKGTYFEELIVTYFKNEASYRDLYSDVWTYADWAALQGLPKKDTGIDLVARTYGTDEFHAIQCKFYGENEKIPKDGINSFLADASRKYFSHRIIVTTSNNWGGNAEQTLFNQDPPVSLINLHDLENSQIDWAKYQPEKAIVLKEKKTLRPHQQSALTAVTAGLRDADRGKLIMACGTGKTFTSLKIAESIAGKGKRVLFLVPSLSLLSQSLTEWTQESETPLHSFAVCSDSDVGKKRSQDDDSVQTFAHELQYPATTEPKSLAREMAARHDAEHMSVVFSTYHSIDVIGEAQSKYDLSEFDLIICDEAHRTTGAIFDGDDESAFVKVHDARFIKAAKRLYMTATPRIYGDMAKASAEKDSVTLCSMDDESLYGKELYVITFSEAVKRGLLVDYKVLVLAVDENHVNSRLQKLLADENNQIKVDDAAKIIGCWKALSKQGMSDDVLDDLEPMRRAVAFCQVIEYQKGAKTHKVSSKNIASMFQSVIEAYQENEIAENGDSNPLICEAEHVDGGMNASQKEAKLDWLKAEIPENTCRILSNVRCLSEGVDVPALDSVLFLTPRNSQVDVVQSVGRVMRNAPGKKRGYVVLPVVIPAGVEPHEALNDNKTYKVVWQVLQALRSHDDRFDALINKLDLIGNDRSKMEVIAITDTIAKKAKTASGKQAKHAGKGVFGIGEDHGGNKTPEQMPIEFEIGEIERAIYAKVVQKCGNRNHWEDWAKDIAKIAKTHIGRITAIVNNPKNTVEVSKFNSFVDELRDDLNGSITDDEVIEMLAQHLITKPVFDALFSDYDFAKNNSISCAMQSVLDVLHEHHLDKEVDTLTKFYESVKMRAEGIESAQGKQKLVVELYDRFFSYAFPRMTERLGIVYTPVEVVDFIIHSVNDILKSHFNQTLGSENVHIIDPFTGTGTFITRLLQSGLISKDKLPHKYANEIHANEIVLLAYYIAAINIEAVYHGIMGDKSYKPFNGICLTDTFQMYEKEDLISGLLEDNSTRRKKQKNLDIRVIMANPPYSSGDKNANNNKNIDYPCLDSRITETYISKSSKEMGKSKIYDSYIRAIRWASDRIGDSGVIGFVSGSGFIDSSSTDGLRRALSDEFSSIYIFNLRGNVRKNMLTKGRAKEGQNIFGSKSMTGIAISVLVKNPNSENTGHIKYYDIGDDLSCNEKLETISKFSSIDGINDWQDIIPDKHGDWLKQRDDSFSSHIVMGEKKGSNHKLFKKYSMGIKTNRDDWAYNKSRSALIANMKRTIGFYNNEVDRYKVENKKNLDVNNFISRDSKNIKWTTDIVSDLEKGKHSTFDEQSICVSMYRPFEKQWVYANKTWNWTRHLIPEMFPNPKVKNRVIMVKTRWHNGQIAFISDVPPTFTSDGGEQCFPLFLYEPDNDILNGYDVRDNLFSASERRQGASEHGFVQKYAITDEGLKHFTDAYSNKSISKADIFYYVYGILHSPDYFALFADNLGKELPRIPVVKTINDFCHFSKAGRDLAELHLNYESVNPYPLRLVVAGNKKLEDADYRVVKMKYGRVGKDKDLSTLIYNQKITLTGIPLEAYDYIVNGKPALDWVIERQCVKYDEETGIVNDANDWAIETMHNPKYPLELFQRVITVSLETMKIIKGLPKLDI